MTDIERAQYNNLTQSQREDYDYQRKKHPNWSHNQIITKVMLEDSIGNIVDNGGGTLDPETLKDNPQFLKQVLEGAKAALYEAGIFISEVFEVIDNAISSLGYLIMTGVRYIGNKLSEFWDWLTS